MLKDNVESSKQLEELFSDPCVKGRADGTEQRVCLRALKSCVARFTVVTRPVGRESVGIIPRRAGADQDEVDHPTCERVAAVFKCG